MHTADTVGPFGLFFYFFSHPHYQTHGVVGDTVTVSRVGTRVARLIRDPIHEGFNFNQIQALLLEDKYIHTPFLRYIKNK